MVGGRRGCGRPVKRRRSAGDGSETAPEGGDRGGSRVRRLSARGRRLDVASCRALGARRQQRRARGSSAAGSRTAWGAASGFRRSRGSRRRPPMVESRRSEARRAGDLMPFRPCRPPIRAGSGRAMGRRGGSGAALTRLGGAGGGIALSEPMPKSPRARFPYTCVGARATTEFFWVCEEGDRFALQSGCAILGRSTRGMLERRHGAARSVQRSAQRPPIALGA